MKSPLLGESRDLTEVEQALLHALVEQAPVAVFQALNVKLNHRGLAITIDKLNSMVEGR